MKEQKIGGYEMVEFLNLDEARLYIVCIERRSGYNNYWYAPASWVYA